MYQLLSLDFYIDLIFFLISYHFHFFQNIYNLIKLLDLLINIIFLIQYYIYILFEEIHSQIYNIDIYIVFYYYFIFFGISYWINKKLISKEIFISFFNFI